MVEVCSEQDQVGDERRALRKKVAANVTFIFRFVKKSSENTDKHFFFFFRLQERPEEFHESLRQIPMRWRSSLSCIMTSMASGGGLDEHGGATGGGGNGGTVGMNAGGGGGGGGTGGGGGGGGERKVRQRVLQPAGGRDPSWFSRV